MIKTNRGFKHAFREANKALNFPVKKGWLRFQGPTTMRNPTGCYCPATLVALHRSGESFCIFEVALSAEAAEIDEALARRVMVSCDNKDGKGPDWDADLSAFFDAFLADG